MFNFIVIDLQDRFIHQNNNLEEVSLKIKEHIINNGISPLFIMDEIDGDHLDFPQSLFEIEEEYDEDLEEYTEEVVFSPLEEQYLHKSYAFFRDIMDKNYDEEEIIELGRWMLKNSIFCIRELSEDDGLVDKISQELSHNSIVEDYDFEDASMRFNIPRDLYDGIKQLFSKECQLVGGGRNECLKEIALLLDIMDHPYKIIEELTY